MGSVYVHTLLGTMVTASTYFFNLALLDHHHMIHHHAPLATPLCASLLCGVVGQLVIEEVTWGVLPALCTCGLSATLKLVVVVGSVFIFHCLPINSWYTLYHRQQTWYCSKAFSIYLNQGALLSNGKNQYHGSHHHWIPWSHHHWIPWSPSPLDTMVPSPLDTMVPSPLDTMVPITIGYHGPHHHWIPLSPSPLEYI